ncbi:PLC-like phosphodiesterase [Aaosphaeria arxii CBS 175.79]|uniref:glycerophosphodiester phosphodiesterase n=1 Tax=Aaosphaeria arxii CBS 175.79 TaxID=1450172 RepID=A0A6A5XPJ4_9PLEO|nr:PLC-like phosphodiesterase [Aaosphaeria arxii CBS 175.79]KAF2014757.1 PLC-like phosphodiesterase [Aaosphaeria arxii CBS 175.79]
MHSLFTSGLLIAAASAAVVPKSTGYPTPGKGHHGRNINVQVGSRPEWLVHNMDEGELKEKLLSCSEGPFTTSDFTFSHRGAPLQFPEHTIEGYRAARREGAGVVECDVAFTSDKQLVCRHSHCDLHTTTDILLHPELAAKCTTPFEPASNGTAAKAKCCTSDITVKEFKTLCAKMDGFNPNGTTIAEYMDGTPPFRTDLYSDSVCGTLATHDEFLELIDGWGLKFTSELKTPEVKMPFNNYTQAQFAQDLVNEYKARNIDPKRVFLQSFLPDDIFYWIDNEPAFGEQALYLDERVDTPEGYVNATGSMDELVKRGVKILAPPIFALVSLTEDNSTVIPSDYALAAKKAGLEITSWSFERSGFLNKGGDYYYQSVAPAINNDGDMYTVLDVLVQQVGIKAMFSDWPASVTYYASCFGL